MIFWLLGLLTLTPLISAPIALLLGMLMALLKWVPSHFNLNHWVKKLLAVAIVGLGFGIDGSTAWSLIVSHGVFMVFLIIATLLLALSLGKWLKVGAVESYLLGSGSAICGGSAIAAVGPVINARADQLAIVLGTVFTFNAIAIVIFPWLGQWLQLSQHDFGVWVALAIHDTAAVIGAAEVYGEHALMTATTVKLLRALFIIPLVLSTVLWMRYRAPAIQAQGGQARVPLFIVLFTLAVVINSALPQGQVLYEWVFTGARSLLAGCLYLIGAGLAWSAIKQAGWRPFILALCVWIFVAAVSLSWVLI